MRVSGEFFRASIMQRMAFAMAIVLAFAGMSENFSGDIWFGVPALFPKLNSVLYLILAVLIIRGGRYASALMALQFACAELIAFKAFEGGLQSGFLYLIVLSVFLFKAGALLFLCTAGVSGIRRRFIPKNQRPEEGQLLTWLTSITTALVVWNLGYQWSMIS